MHAHKTCIFENVRLNLHGQLQTGFNLRNASHCCAVRYICRIVTIIIIIIRTLLVIISAWATALRQQRFGNGRWFAVGATMTAYAGQHYPQ